MHTPFPNTVARHALVYNPWLAACSRSTSLRRHDYEAFGSTLIAPEGDFGGGKIAPGPILALVGYFGKQR